MTQIEIAPDNKFIVLLIADSAGAVKTLHTINGTHYGRLLPVFREGGELSSFKAWALHGLRPGYEIRTLLILAEDIDKVRVTLAARNLLPAGETRVALEGTDFFDEVIAQMLTDTLWADPG